MKRDARPAPALPIALLGAVLAQGSAGGSEKPAGDRCFGLIACCRVNRSTQRPRLGYAPLFSYLLKLADTIDVEYVSAANGHSCHSFHMVWPYRMTNRAFFALS